MVSPRAFLPPKPRLWGEFTDKKKGMAKTMNMPSLRCLTRDIQMYNKRENEARIEAGLVVQEHPVQGEAGTAPRLQISECSTSPNLFPSTPHHETKPGVIYPSGSCRLFGDSPVFLICHFAHGHLDWPEISLSRGAPKAVTQLSLPYKIHTTPQKLCSLIQKSKAEIIPFLTPCSFSPCYTAFWNSKPSRQIPRKAFSSFSFPVRRVGSMAGWAVPCHQLCSPCGWDGAQVRSQRCPELPICHSPAPWGFAPAIALHSSRLWLLGSEIPTPAARQAPVTATASQVLCQLLLALLSCNSPWHTLLEPWLKIRSLQ